MNILLFPLILASLAAVPAGENHPVENPVFKKLLAEGVKMSDGTTYKLQPPIMADGLDAKGQQAAMAKMADPRHPVNELLRKDAFADVVTKIRTVKSAEGEGPAIRAIDSWFVAHGDWKTLTSKEFLESANANESGKSRVVVKSGFLNEKELQQRKLAATVKDGYEERFLYTTFLLFERVEISATRFATLTRGDDSVLAAGKIDARFDKDKDYPNQWRPLMRDALAEIKPGPAQPFSWAGGYAKITRLKNPADAVFIEFHLIYEEPYGWFDGVNLVKQKVPAMVKEKVRAFRRKLGAAGEEKPQ
jgi:hypothetical protein